MAGDKGFAAVANQEWERSVAYRAVLAKHGLEFTQAQLRDAAHRHKGWLGVKARLGPVWKADLDPRLRDFVLPRLRERDPRLPDLWDDLVFPLPPLDTCPIILNPADWVPGRIQDWESMRKCVPAGTPPDLLDALMEVLGDLVGEFIRLLEDAGRPIEVGAPPVVVPDERAFGVTVQMSDVGQTVMLTRRPAAGGTAAVTSPTLAGPQVLEHIQVSSEVAFAGYAELLVVDPGVDVSSASGLGVVQGDPVFRSAGGAAGTAQAVPLLPLSSVGEFWPRRYVPRSGFRLVFVVRNDSAAARDVVCAVDGRFTLRQAS